MFLRFRMSAVGQHPAAATRTSQVQAKASATLSRAPTSPELRPDIAVSPTVDDVLTSSDFDVDKFQSYDVGASGLQRLQEMSAKLLTSLEGLNNLDVLGLPSFPEPSGDMAKVSDSEARRIKRALAREARKAATSAAPTSTASARQDLSSLRENKQRLENLMDQAPVPSSKLGKAPRASSTKAAPKSVALSVQRRQLGQTTSSVAGPSLLSPPAKDIHAEPSSRAKEANARRAGLSARRVVAASVMDGVVRSTTRASSGADGTSQFMKKASSLDLLNGISEKELTTIVKDLLFLEGVKKNMRGILKRNPTMEEWARATSMDVWTFAERLDAGQQAKAQMLKANYRLVISICKKYQFKGIGMQDLITEGMQGLLKGVEKFDPTKGFRFSTYAHWWIRQAITRSLSDQSRTVRLPAHMIELLNKITSAKTALIEEHGREPSMELLSLKTGMTPQRIQEILELVKPANSLDAPAGDEDGMDTMKDMLQDERSTPDVVLDEVMLRKDLSKILADLTVREAGVVRLRFGLDGERETTLEEIGVLFSLTRERIRQIEAKAVRKLRMKQKEAVGILREYSLSTDESEMVGRRNHGTNKSG